MRQTQLALLAALLAMPSMALAQAWPNDPKANIEERPDSTEQALALPAAPRPEHLIEFDAGPTQRALRYYVDTASLSVGKDDVVRFTVVATNDTGANNVSFEGFKCNDAQRKVYAYGKADGGWSVVADPKWIPIGAARTDGHRRVLYTDFFCPARGRIVSAAEGVDALKRGMHPRAADLTNTPPMPR